MERPLYLWHIPKAGGTSATLALDELFAPEAIAPGGILSDVRGLGADELDRFGFIRGMFGSVPVERLGWRGVTTLVLIRRPVDLVLSLYAHVRDQPSHYLHEQARDAPFSEFIRGQAWGALASNPQARWLAVSPLGPAATWAPPVAADHPLRAQAAFELWPHGLGERALWRRARGVLERADVVGTTDGMAEALDRAARLVGAAPLGALPVERKNVSTQRPTVITTTPRDLAHLEQMTRVDARLYALAQARRGGGRGGMAHRLRAALR